MTGQLLHVWYCHLDLKRKLRLTVPHLEGVRSSSTPHPTPACVHTHPPFTFPEAANLLHPNQGLRLPFHHLHYFLAAERRRASFLCCDPPFHTTAPAELSPQHTQASFRAGVCNFPEQPFFNENNVWILEQAAHLCILFLKRSSLA